MLGVGFVLSAMIWALVCYRKIPALLWGVFYVLLLGAIFLYVAPGNFIRYEFAGSPEVWAQPAMNAELVFNQWFYDEMYRLLHLLLFAVSLITLLVLAFRSKFGVSVSISLFLVVAALAGFLFVGKHAGEITGGRYAWGVFHACALLFFGGYLTKVRQNPYFFVCYLAVIVSQIMLLFIPGIGPRTSIPVLLVLMTAIIVLCSELLELIGRKGLYVLTVCTLVFMAFGVNHAYPIKAAYEKNSIAWENNVSRINIWKIDDKGKGPLVLKKLPDMGAHWEMPYQNPYFLKYFLYELDIPEDAIVVWEGTDTDYRQRHLLRHFSEKGGAFEGSKKVEHINVGLRQQEGFFCNLHSWENYIVFSFNIWACGATHPFKITVGESPDALLGWYEARLRHDQYMLTVHNLSGPLSTDFIYTIDGEAEAQKYNYVGVSWLGFDVVIR